MAFLPLPMAPGGGAKNGAIARPIQNLGGDSLTDGWRRLQYPLAFFFKKSVGIASQNINDNDAKINSLPTWIFFGLFNGQLIFFKINFFEKIFLECLQSVKQFGS